LVSAAVSADRPAPRGRRRARLGAAAFWLLGSAIAVLAQPSSDRRLAAAGAALAGIVTILVVSRLTPDPGRRYFRAVLGTVVAVSVVGDWLVQHLVGGANGFVAYGFDTRIALPLIFVLAAPLVLQELPVRLRSRALWRDRALIVRQAQPLDWLAAAYTLLIIPDLLLGLAHHAPKSYVAQDLGLIVFFVFAYVAGRVVSVRAGRDLAEELVAVLVVLAGVQALVNLDTTPVFTYVDAACTGAIAFALFRPNRSRLLLLCIAVALLVNDAVAVKQGSGSTTAIELAGALAIVAYLVVRARHLVPQWLVLGIALVALAGFFAFTSDGAGVAGRYYGTDPSKAGRTYEAGAVRTAVHSSPLSFVFGRGLGGSIDETGAPRLFAESLAYGGRDLAHVQEVHLLPYEFLLKYGLLGFAWLAAFAVAVVILGVRALETASRHRDPTLVIYAALPLLGIVEALAAATHLQDNPLNSFALGVLVTRLGGMVSPRFRLGLAIPAAAVICGVVGAVAFTKPAALGYKGPGPDLLNIPLPGLGKVGDVRFNYPLDYHRRYFATSAGRHGGIVVASYPLKRHPQLGGSGESLRREGVFFQLDELPRRAHYRAPKKAFPMSIFDLSTVPSLRSTATTEQGGVTFNVNGRNYRAVVWVGKHAPKKALTVVDELVLSIRPS
jgi:hypothetical protein